MLVATNDRLMDAKKHVIEVCGRVNAENGYVTGQRAPAISASSTDTGAGCEGYVWVRKLDDNFVLGAEITAEDIGTMRVRLLDGYPMITWTDDVDVAFKLVNDHAKQFYST